MHGLAAAGMRSQMPWLPLCRLHTAWWRRRTTQRGRLMLQVSPTLPPAAWKLMTACTFRPLAAIRSNSRLYAEKSYRRGPACSTMPHHTSTMTPSTPACAPRDGTVSYVTVVIPDVLFAWATGAADDLVGSGMVERGAGLSGAGGGAGGKA